MKVMKFSKDVTTNNVIFYSGLKEGTLRDHVLVADNNIGENDANEQIQTAINAIKSSGIEYVIAPGFADKFHKDAVAIGLHIIKCNDSKSLEKGDNIEIHLKEGLILNIDTEQECKIKPM